jgi:hypothetical protein
MVRHVATNLQSTVSRVGTLVLEVNLTLLCPWTSDGAPRGHQPAVVSFSGRNPSSQGEPNLAVSMDQ